MRKAIRLRRGRAQAFLALGCLAGALTAAPIAAADAEPILQAVRVGPSLSLTPKLGAACVDLHGAWSARESGTMTCRVTAPGLSETDTDEFAGSGTVDIEQPLGQCSFAYDPVFSGTGSGFRPARRTGRIEDDAITISGPFAIAVPGVPGVTITTNTVEAAGRVTGDSSIELTGSGRLVGTVPGDGGVLVNLDCTIATTASLSRRTRPHVPPGAPVLLSQGVVNGANFQPGALAPDSWADAFGQNLAEGFVLDGALPDALGGTSVTVTDSRGASRRARLHFVSPDRVQFLLPPGMATGPATLEITNHTGASSAVSLSIAPVAPGLFSANASGLGPAAATFLRVRSDGSRTEDFTFTLDSPPGRRNVPIDVGVDGDEVYVSFFGTGFRGQSRTSVTIGGAPVPVVGAVAQGQFLGLDQLVVGPLPRALAGQGDVDVVFTADDRPANVVTIGVSANGADPCSVGFQQPAISPAQIKIISRVTGFGASATPAAIYRVSNPNQAEMSFTLEADVPWISFNPSDLSALGATPAAGSATAGVYLNDGADALPAGDHEAVLTFASQDCGVREERRIRLSVREDPGASWSFFGESCAEAAFAACVSMNVRTEPKAGPSGREGTKVEIWARNLDDDDQPVETTPWGSALTLLRIRRFGEMPEFARSFRQFGRIAQVRLEGSVADFLDAKCSDPECQRVHCPGGRPCEHYLEQPWSLSANRDEIFVQGGAVHGCPVATPEPNAFTWVGGNWWTCRRQGWDGWVVISFETDAIWDARDLRRPSWRVWAPTARPSIFTNTPAEAIEMF